MRAYIRECLRGKSLLHILLVYCKSFRHMGSDNSNTSPVLFVFNPLRSIQISCISSLFQYIYIFLRVCFAFTVFFYRMMTKLYFFSSISAQVLLFILFLEFYLILFLFFDCCFSLSFFFIFIFLHLFIFLTRRSLIHYPLSSFSSSLLFIFIFFFLFCLHSLS